LHPEPALSLPRQIKSRRSRLRRPLRIRPVFGPLQNCHRTCDEARHIGTIRRNVQRVARLGEFLRTRRLKVPRPSRTVIIRGPRIMKCGWATVPRTHFECHCIGDRVSMGCYIGQLLANGRYSSIDRVLVVVEYSENVAKHRCFLRGWRVGHNPERRAGYLPGLCAASRRLNFLFASSKVFTIPSLDFQHPVELVRSLFVGSAE